LAELAAAEGKNEKAIEYADRLLNLAERGGMRERMAQAHRWRGIALQAMKQSEAAGKELRRAADLARVIGSPRLLWDIHDALAHYYGALGDSQMMTHHEEQVKKNVASIAAGVDDEALKASLPFGA
jgi:tetratricopeptide (TPR) repeat protein